MKTEFYIITGLSGAGKSQALKILEDLGFFCVDNLPVALVPTFADMCLDEKNGLDKVALGIDVRAGKNYLSSLDKNLELIRGKGIKYKIIYFRADEATLAHRYSETRRKHPLGKRVVDAIRGEKKLLEKIRLKSDLEIDTSHLTLGELKEILGRLLGISSDVLKISVVSFGYKFGIPVDADLVIDVRFLPNPNYVASLREKTGKDSSVKRYVERQKPTKEFFGRFLKLLEFLVPLYINEGKSYLTIGIGCTGGRHRSVVVAERVAAFLRKIKYNPVIHHRDIERKLLPG
ncbi:MAG TPA: RNase adapter RapZ [Elusimicrobia bacterium]|nr:MAG: RNase adaptor protein RapZ [Elusimicrobia bacterium RIFOXYA12_FULL_49_49]OGS09679.1 MAG: RNase adaptor protein RapZ [Elusimicrobia bacterium RIFOXYB1_FULL_48_9]OGS15568.1 MAG: RNase adaptor protein RapZ [Elusimicrobia bacterium RIFOXYA2_FULL_47_53]OGS26876.1 MAG: RNase adaptor protein RapZ [Elusimicrobia bacterium RIFOXYB12_FULL_50_12]OGS30667.1 MAG: RNase adaptor protein RapZ [Elusimicrobia bacterium RIFOXYB2_FULL_46_23]HBU68856.1 RNase adapter RapZ [Elusimicrobiota bacterium]